MPEVAEGKAEASEQLFTNWNQIVYMGNREVALRSRNRTDFPNLVSICGMKETDKARSECHIIGERSCD